MGRGILRIAFVLHSLAYAQALAHTSLMAELEPRLRRIQPEEHNSSRLLKYLLSHLKVDIRLVDEFCCIEVRSRSHFDKKGESKEFG